MKKVFLIVPSLILALIVFHPATAAPTGPTASVWITPESAKKGDKAELSAFVYNSTPKTVTVSVLFATPDDDIATIILTLPTQTAKTATTDWVVPAPQTVVTASIIKAVDASQKNIPELLGPLGVVTAGAPTALSIGSFKIGSSTWFSSIFGTIDPWRLKQAKYFATLRDATKKKVGYGAVPDITSHFELPTSDVPGTAGQPKPATDNTKGFPIGSYATLLYATALAALFASAALFYIIGILLVILILRFFVRLFL